MPSFYETPDEVRIDVDVDEFYSACDSCEIEELIDLLIEDGHVSPEAKTVGKGKLYSEVEWEKTLERLRLNRMSLSSEEIALIESISNRF